MALDYKSAVTALVSFDGFSARTLKLHLAIQTVLDWANQAESEEDGFFNEPFDAVSTFTDFVDEDQELETDSDGWCELNRIIIDDYLTEYVALNLKIKDNQIQKELPFNG